jgi:hypothetical protein
MVSFLTHETDFHCITLIENEDRLRDLLGTMIGNEERGTFTLIRNEEKGLSRHTEKYTGVGSMEMEQCVSSGTLIWTALYV